MGVGNSCLLTGHILCGTRITVTKRGRPAKPAAQRLSVMVRHRLTKAEYRKLCREAKQAGLSVSEYARKKLFGEKQ
jgi:mobilization protein NikA